jgi:hypothetical protein
MTTEEKANPKCEAEQRVQIPRLGPTIPADRPKGGEVKVECKLRDYDDAIVWAEGEDRLIVRRPNIEPSGFVLIEIEGKRATVKASEILEAVRACCS